MPTCHDWHSWHLYKYTSKRTKHSVSYYDPCCYRVHKLYRDNDVYAKEWQSICCLPSLFRYDHLCLVLVELCPQRVVVEEHLSLPRHL